MCFLVRIRTLCTDPAQHRKATDKGSTVDYLDHDLSAVDDLDHDMSTVDDLDHICLR